MLEKLTLPETNIAPERKWWFPIGISFSRGLCSGAKAMLVLRRVPRNFPLKNMAQTLHVGDPTAQKNQLRTLDFSTALMTRSCRGNWEKNQASPATLPKTNGKFTPENRPKRPKRKGSYSNHPV